MRRFCPVVAVAGALSLLVYAALQSDVTGRDTRFHSMLSNTFQWIQKRKEYTTNVPSTVINVKRLTTALHKTVAESTRRFSSSGGATKLPEMTKTTNQDSKLTPIAVLHKDSFKKMPEWDFDDTYLLHPQSKEKTCTNSIQAIDDAEFKKAFLPNIQLFMHKGHLNMRVWNKLSHFNNPFGFMDYTNYSEVKEAVDLLPNHKTGKFLEAPADEKQGCVRCAVVGNGGILNGSRKGSEIDSHHYVFRMNGAITKGFEEDVGNKTSVYVYTAHSMITSPILFKEFGFDDIPRDEGIKYVMIPEGIDDYRWISGLLQNTAITRGIYEGVWPFKYYGGQVDLNRFYVLHPEFLRYIRNRFMKSPQLQDQQWSIFRPTNGAFTIFLALHTCDTVDAYGFITEDYKKYANYYFERFSHTEVVFYINHDYGLEIKTWKSLHDKKVIHLYQGKVDTNKTTLQ
ncbi:alpha-N-acetylgalactosaminide alpha-2,6-sialyltransferase 2-like isoform X1 [Denticeps clupeoides]|nr:alpha-N-acetylgalactosaminide alpha-2,6-sialyltransferase 2-like isoform X1 [Denticeps clupeoides]